MGHARHLLVLSGTLLVLAASSCGGGGGTNGRRDPVVFTGKATEVPEIVAEFRTELGRDNGGNPERGFTGRREISWDDVPDGNSAPGFLSPDFFNSRTEPFARGIRVTTPGDGVQVSADADNPTLTPVRFGNVNAQYPSLFETFSPERLVAPIGSNVIDVTFTIPGSPDEPALVRGFGAIFTDVDTDRSSIELFAEDDVSFGKFSVPANGGGLSFLGLLFDNSVVKRVRITYGNSALGPRNGGDVDVVATDDFIVAEPQPQD